MASASAGVHLAGTHCAQDPNFRLSAINSGWTEHPHACHSQKLVVEVESRGNAGGREDPAEVEREYSDHVKKHCVDARERHFGDVRELTFDVPITVEPY